MRLEPVLRLDFAGSQRTLNTWVGFIIDLETLPTKVDSQIAKADLVLHIILQRVGVEIEQPLREERVAQELSVIKARRRVAFIGIKTTRLREVVMLVPATDSHFMVANFSVQRAEYAATLDVILGCARRHGHAIWTWNIWSAPCPLTGIIVIICLDLEGDAIGQRCGQAIRRQRIFAQTRSIIIAVIDVVDWGNIYTTRRGNRLGIIGEIVVMVITEAINHLEREILIILLGAVGIGEESVKFGITHGNDGLGVYVHAALFAAALPLVGIVVNAG